MKTLTNKRTALLAKVLDTLSDEQLPYVQDNIHNPLVLDVIKAMRPQTVPLIEQIEKVDRMLSKWHRLKTRNSILFGTRYVGETAPYCGHGYTQYTFDSYVVSFSEHDDTYHKRFGVVE
jgi:hypothetical protein